MMRYHYGRNILDCNSTHCPGWNSVGTVYGTCCAFNYYPNKDNYSVLNQFDKFGGIQILFSGQKLQMTGLFLVISQPGAFVTRYDDIFALVPASDNYLSISSTYDVVTSHFERLPLESRQCLLPKDGKSSRVFRSRCMLSCALQTMYKECGCHPYFMPITLQGDKVFRNCTVYDLTCFQDKKGEWYSI